MKLPRDSQGIPMQLTAATTALAKTYDTTISSATSVTLATRTKLLEVTAIGQGIFMKYAAGASSSDFDEFIGAWTTRHYEVPTGVTVVSFIEQAASATLVLIEK